jgi:hypothetical protein
VAAVEMTGEVAGAQQKVPGAFQHVGAFGTSFMGLSCSLACRGLS